MWCLLTYCFRSVVVFLTFNLGLCVSVTNLSNTEHERQNCFCFFLLPYLAFWPQCLLSSLWFLCLSNLPLAGRYRLAIISSFQFKSTPIMALWLPLKMEYWRSHSDPPTLTQNHKSKSQVSHISWVASFMHPLFTICFGQYMMTINKLKVTIGYLHEYTYCSTKIVDTLIRLKIVDLAFLNLLD